MRRAASLVALLVVAACSSGGGGGAASSPTTGGPTSTSTSSSSSVPTTTTTVEEAPSAAPRTATSAAELAIQLTAAEEVIHDRTIPDDAPRLRRAAQAEQVALRTLADNPAWDAEVAAALPEPLRAHAAANAAAGRELRSLVRSPKPTLPAWTIVEPAPSAELRRYYEEGEASFGVPWEYLAAVHLTETRMGRIRGTSTAGAQGPMQFLPSTWAAYGGGGDIQSNRDAILGAARYLAANGGGRGDLRNALFRYNPTEKYVRAVTAYAERMIADPMAYRAYWGWQVYYWSTLGDVWLRPGFRLDASRPVTPADLN